MRVLREQNIVPVIDPRHKWFLPLKEYECGANYCPFEGYWPGDEYAPMMEAFELIYGSHTSIQRFFLRKIYD